MRLPIPARRAARSVLQIALAVMSSFGAWFLAGGTLGDSDSFAGWARLLAFAIPIRAVIYWPFGLYRSLWRYASVRELIAIAAAVFAGSAVIAVVAAALGVTAVLPTGFFVIDALLLVFLLGAVRILPRLPTERSRDVARRKVLVVGAGDAGAMILRDMLYRAESQYEPLGVIDDDPAKHGLRVHGVKVLGGREILGTVMARLRPDEVLVAIPSATLATLRAIVNALQPFDVPIKTLPSIRELRECHVELAQIRPLALEDLLTRPVVGLDQTGIHALIHGRRVLVTGAGGSIGSELCRQLLRWTPEALVLVERHENALFWLSSELQSRGAGTTRLTPALLDVTNEQALERLFASTHPHIVFHAAAHKHVPMLEDQVSEAVRNNLLGTLTTARVAERHGVERFVMISTDKAVNPVSVMGATKRLCELAVQTLMRNSRTRFCAVRFGNVLGSNGSVTLVFLRQIEAGGPVTVTHPDMRRYFMLISEAVELVAHAATLAEPGTVYVLEMGEPIRIVDLARQLVRLAGYRPDVDIPIQFTGLRPGERLEEALVDQTEHTIGCETRGLFRVVADALPEPDRFAAHLATLQRQAQSPHLTITLDTLLEMIPRPEAVPARHTATG